MLRIRLSMGGVRKRPIYKIVIADSRYPRDGKFIEKIGSYNPLLPKDKKERIKVEAERVKYWMTRRGAVNAYAKTWKQSSKGNTKKR